MSADQETLAESALRRRVSLPGCFVVLVTAGLSLGPGASASASDFFGPSQGLQLQPELDVIRHLADAFRVTLKVEPTWIPSEHYGEMGFSVYGDWLMAPFFDAVLSPDLTKRRRLDVRVGASWYPAVSAGTSGWSNVLRLEAEATARTMILGRILATLRNRVEAQWQLDEPTSFVWRLRARPQLEWEFALSSRPVPRSRPSRTWSSSGRPPGTCGPSSACRRGSSWESNWFAKGQVIEVNASVFTNLQPSRSYSPVVGAVWYQCF